MHLKLKSDSKTHLSLFHHLVSSYQTNDETVKGLEGMLKSAIEIAKSTKEAQIVEQDSLEHIFVVYPSGTVCLYREVGSYEVYDEGF